MRNLNRWLIIAIIVILLSGLFLTLWTVQRQENILRSDLISKTRLMQGSLDIGQVKNLTGTETDLISPSYQRLKGQMMNVQSADPLIRFIYLMGQRPDGTVFFYMDSEPSSSEDYSFPGQNYPEVSSVILNVFRNGTETTEGPLTDRWGTWVSGLVPIRDQDNGLVIAVVGMDIDAGDWNIQLINASAPAVIAMLLLLFLLLIFFYVQQRNNREREILAASEALMKESERRLTDIINFFPDAILVIDRNSRVISWNKAIEEMTGVSADAMLGKGDYEYSIPFYGDRRPILIDLVFRDGEEIQKMYPYIQKDGNKYISEIYLPRLYGGKGAHLWFIVSPLYDAKGSITGAIESIRDITSRKQAEYALQKSEEQFRTVFEKGPLGMVIVDDSYRFVKANPMFCSMVGYSEDELLTRTFTDVTHPDYIAQDISQVQQLITGKISEYSTEKQYIRKDGRIFWGLVVVSAVRDRDGKFLYYLALITDISERKAMEVIQETHNADVLRFAEDLKHTNEKLNLLNNITRHDILNQLTIILGYLEMMKAKFSDPSLQDYIEKEMHAAQNIRTQIMFTKDYQDIGVQSPQWFNLNMIIVSNAAGLPLSTVNLDVHCDNLEIFADPLIGKVFYTLLENAIRHGKTVTTIGFSYQILSGDLIVVYQDNGIGIPAEYKEAVFQRKFFMHTGFGLYLSQTILGITGMKIRENGVPGKGARFEIFIPEGAFRFISNS
jgi:PAS domain S-box-containing protein